MKKTIIVMPVANEEETMDHPVEKKIPATMVARQVVPPNSPLCLLLL